MGICMQLLKMLGRTGIWFEVETYLQESLGNGDSWEFAWWSRYSAAEFRQDILINRKHWNVSYVSKTVQSLLCLDCAHSNANF